MCVQFLQDTGEFQQAEEVLNKVVQVEPDNPLGYFSLGLVTTPSPYCLHRNFSTSQKVSVGKCVVLTMNMAHAVQVLPIVPRTCTYHVYTVLNCSVLSPYNNRMLKIIYCGVI